MSTVDGGKDQGDGDCSFAEQSAYKQIEAPNGIADVAPDAPDIGEPVVANLYRRGSDRIWRSLGPAMSYLASDEDDPCADTPTLG